MLTGLTNTLIQQQISNPERLLMGLTTLLFHRKTQITTPQLLTNLSVQIR
jgi:hypothetical protein